jgi:hypothetical protein
MSTTVNDKSPDIVIDERLEDETDRLEPPHVEITLTDLTINTFEKGKNPSEHPVEEPHDFDSGDNTTIRRTRNKKILIALCLLSFVIFVIVDTATTGHVKKALRSLLTWIEDNPMLGFFVFMLVYMVSVGELIARQILPLVSESVQAQLLTFPTFPPSPSYPGVDFNPRCGLRVCQGIWFGTRSRTRFSVRLPRGITRSHDCFPVRALLVSRLGQTIDQKI